MKIEQCGYAAQLVAAEFGYLHNQHAVLERDGARLVFAGVDDIAAGSSGENRHQADLRAALLGTRDDDPVAVTAVIVGYR